MRVTAFVLAALLSSCGASHEDGDPTDQQNDARAEEGANAVDAARPLREAAAPSGDASAPARDASGLVEDAGRPAADGAAPVALDAGAASNPNAASYVIGVTNGINCCTFYLIAKSDPVGDYCAVVEFMTYDGTGMVLVTQEGTVYQGSQSCVGDEPFVFRNPAEAGVVSDALEGTIDVTADFGFDVDLTLSFPGVEPWVPERVRMRALGLSWGEGWQSE